MPLRRVRGMLLRFVRRRFSAIAVGVGLVVPAAWLEFGARIDAWWLEGAALVLGATGMAILWTGLTGAASDWVDPEEF